VLPEILGPFDRAHACAYEDVKIAPQDTVLACERRSRSADLWLEDNCLTEAGGDSSGHLCALPKQSGREDTSAAARQGWRVVLVQRAPPLRAAVKRRKRVGQAGSAAAGRERRSLRSPSARLIAKRRAIFLVLGAKGCKPSCSFAYESYKDGRLSLNGSRGGF
jgi:hypothetical protein